MGLVLELLAILQMPAFPRVTLQIGTLFLAAFRLQQPG